MQKGYYKRQDIDYKTANILAFISNTVPRQKSHPKGSEPYTAMDFMPGVKEVEKHSVEDRQKMAEEAVKNTERFNKGVVYKKA